MVYWTSLGSLGRGYVIFEPYMCVFWLFIVIFFFGLLLFVVVAFCLSWPGFAGAFLISYLAPF